MFCLVRLCSLRCVVFFFNATATTEIYTLSLHDALPISRGCPRSRSRRLGAQGSPQGLAHGCRRSEEHTSELQSLTNLVCRLLLEKKKREEIQFLNASNLVASGRLGPNQLSAALGHGLTP